MADGTQERSDELSVGSNLGKNTTKRATIIQDLYGHLV